jgi:hypothetical protein
VVLFRLCAGEDLTLSFVDANEGCQWEIQTDEDSVPYWDSQMLVDRGGPLSARAKRVCLSWETSLPQKHWYICWSIFWASSFVNHKTCHLIYNNYFITWISWYCMLMCVFAHSCFIENPSVGSWETNPCFLGGFCHNNIRGYNISMTICIDWIIFFLSLL